MEAKLDVGRLSEALSTLNDSAAALEKRLADIRALQKDIVRIINEAERLARQGIEVDAIPATVRTEPQGASAAGVTTFTDAVIAVFEQRPQAHLGVDDVFESLRESRTDATKDRVRNALYYADNQGKLHRVKGRRGKFTLKDTSTPVAAGVDVGEESTSGSSGEIGGGRDESSTPPRDQGGVAFNTQFHLNRAGDRAPIGG